MPESSKIDTNKSMEYAEKRISEAVDAGRLSRKEGRAAFDEAKKSYRNNNYDRVMDMIANRKKS